MTLKCNFKSFLRQKVGWVTNPRCMHPRNLINQGYPFDRIYTVNFSRMVDKLTLAGQGFVGCSGKNVGDHALNRNPKSVSQASFILPGSCITTTSSVCKRYIFCFILLLFAAKSLGPVSVLGSVTSISFTGTDYDCSLNLICLGGAHVYPGDPINQVRSGMLSLTFEDESSSRISGGIAYYVEQVRLKDPHTTQSASFNASFTIEQIIYGSSAGDGMTFVISANNSDPNPTNTSSLKGQDFYLFDYAANETTSFKSVVLEFDTFDNPESPINDINDNHLSFDFSSIHHATIADAAKANVSMNNSNRAVYAWVEYSSSTQQLEARISLNDSRPIMPLLNLTVDLFNLVEEYMWVGFTSGNGVFKSNFYIGKWTFASYGILPGSSPVPSSPVPSSPVPSSPAPSSPVPSSPIKSGGTKLGLIVGTALGVPVALLLACVIIFYFVQRRADSTRRFRVCQLGWGSFSEEDSDSTIAVEGLPTRFSYRELSSATRGFSEESKLGQGGFGNVYRGVLGSSGTPVAVKKINADSNQGEKEFMAEVSIISQLRHRNLIQLCGWCKDASRGNFVLVYELMPNGSLDKVLFGPAHDGMNTLPCLSWPQRLKIVTGTAAALDYLHLGWKQQVIHRDVKSSNIMLDNEWNPKLGDFGLARLVDHQRAAPTTMVAGTYGYIAPEAAISGKFTDKTDVFSFGAVLLEVACGRKALESSADAPEEERILVDWVWEKSSQDDLFSTADKRLGAKYDRHWMKVVLILGLLCSHPDPEARPSMRRVVQVLAGETLVPSIPTSKPDFVLRSQKARNSNGKETRTTSESATSGTSSSVGSMNISDSTQESTGKTGKTWNSLENLYFPM